MKTRINQNLYLQRAEQLRINPNFFLSEPYLALSEAECFTENGWIWMESDGWCLFQPLKCHESILTSTCPNVDKIWSDFDLGLSTPNHQFLDWQYIFNPEHFNEMKGPKWYSFVKNIRKWPKSNENWVYCDRFDRKESGLLLEQWFNRTNGEIQEADLIADFVVFSDHPGIHRRCLYNKNERLVAINVWDENYKYVNFRFCIIDRTEQWLDEFARWLFYTDGQIQKSGKLVNDGGSLSNKGLERFKDKMNPVQKRPVYSWIKK